MSKTNDNWIPFPETIPEYDGFYLLTIQRSYLEKFTPYSDIELRIGFWACNQFFAKLTEEERVIAWTFLPAPYQPKEQTK